MAVSKAILTISQNPVSRSSEESESPLSGQSEIVKMHKAFLPDLAAFLYKAAAYISTAKTPILSHSGRTDSSL